MKIVRTCKLYNTPTNEVSTSLCKYKKCCYCTDMVYKLNKNVSRETLGKN